MRISICLPVKGRPAFFQQALCSILMQGYGDVEIVVKDGNLESPEIYDQGVVKLLSFFRLNLNYRAGKDGGIFPAVNDCLMRSTGDILYFMCDDDLLCPGALASVNAAFERERFPAVHWLYGQTVSADITGKKLGVDGWPTTYEAMLKKNQIGQPSVFWSRGLYEMVGGFDSRYKDAADYDLWLRMWAHREPEFLDQELGVHRHHDRQASRINAKRLEGEAQRISQRHRCLGGEIKRARNIFSAQKVFGGMVPIVEH
jgi:glycosyltransferase involved in cell wall biosynthesis